VGGANFRATFSHAMLTKPLIDGSTSRMQMNTLERGRPSAAISCRRNFGK